MSTFPHKAHSRHAGRRARFFPYLKDFRLSYLEHAGIKGVLHVVHIQLGEPELGQGLVRVDRVGDGTHGEGFQHGRLLHRRNLGGGVLREAAISAIDLLEISGNRHRAVQARHTGQDHIGIEGD